MATEFSVCGPHLAAEAEAAAPSVFIAEQPAKRQAGLAASALVLEAIAPLRDALSQGHEALWARLAQLDAPDQAALAQAAQLLTSRLTAGVSQENFAGEHASALAKRGQPAEGAPRPALPQHITFLQEVFRNKIFGQKAVQCIQPHQLPFDIAKEITDELCRLYFHYGARKKGPDFDTLKYRMEQWLDGASVSELAAQAHRSESSLINQRLSLVEKLIKRAPQEKLLELLDRLNAVINPLFVPQAPNAPAPPSDPPQPSPAPAGATSPPPKPAAPAPAEKEPSASAPTAPAGLQYDPDFAKVAANYQQEIAKKIHALGLGFLMGDGEIEQAALIRLWAAHRKYDPSKGPFAPFARSYIWGGLLDFARSTMTVTRDDNTRMKRIAAMQDQGKSLPEIAAALHVSEAELQRIQQRYHAMGRVLSLDASLAGQDGDPHDSASIIDVTAGAIDPEYAAIEDGMGRAELRRLLEITIRIIDPWEPKQQGRVCATARDRAIFLRKIFDTASSSDLAKEYGVNLPRIGQVCSEIGMQLRRYIEKLGEKEREDWLALLRPPSGF